MVTYFQQSAYSYDLLAQNLSNGKFKAVLQVYTNRRNALLVTLQNLVIQGANGIKLLDAICMFKVRHAFLIAHYYFRLVAVLLIACAPLLEQFAQIVFIELY